MASRPRLLLFLCVVLSTVLFVFTSSAFAQGGSAKSSLGGVVVDTGGGVLPGATVSIKSAGTSVSTEVVTNSSGAFSVPSLDPGTYTVSVSLSGFKTAVIKEVTITAGQPATLNKISLEVGNISQTVEVKGGTDLIQTQSPTISSTLNMNQINNLPAQTRNALYAVTLLPGVDTTANQTARNSTISGLPQYTINITVDGVNTSNNMQRQTDGFYSMVRAQLDAVEEVTVTSATQGADSAGQGAVQIRFVTRSGTNQYKGTIYDYHRDPSLNTNYYFNKINGLPKNHVVVNQFGGSEGGPIRIPGLINGSGKAFFFFNYEEFRQPTAATRTRTIFNPLTASGIFQYTTATGVQQVNLLTLGGQTFAADPTTSALLATIRQYAQSSGVITQSTSNPNNQQYIFQSPGNGIEHLPTTRLDFNLSNSQKLTGTYYWQVVNRFPDIQNNYDVTFPGSPLSSNYLSYRTVGSVTLRSTLGKSLVSTLLGGWQWSPGIFGDGETPDMYASQNGFSLNLPLSYDNLTPGSLNGIEHRNTPNWNIDETVNWLHGRHNFTFGGNFTQIRQIDSNGSTVPTITFGVQSTLDPADALFTTTNFPGASNTNLSDARAIFAYLTGRVTSIGGTARLDDATNKYVYLGTGTHHLKLNEYAGYAQDSWTVKPTLTLNAGVRWELQTPVVPLNSNYATASLADLCGVSGVGTGPFGRTCNIFQPGSLPNAGFQPQFVQYTAGSPGYNTDYNNFAPNVGVAWRPNAQHGFLRAILGDPDQATIRAGFSVAYNRNGMDEFQNIYGGNPGRTTSGTRSNGNNNLVLPGETWPLLFSQTNRLGPPASCPEGTVAVGCIPVTEQFPIPTTIANNLNIFDPNIQLSYARSYSIGLQRSLSKDMAVEVRYVGTRSIGAWTTENWNEVNVIENGFADEFKLAQANLQSNIAAGRGNSFAYFGPGSGTSPLPIFLASYSGVPTSQAADASKYTSTSWTNTTFVGFLSIYNPSPFSFASTNTTNGLYGNSTFRNNGLAAGLPVNFWVMNPAVAGANIRTNGPFTSYDSLQIDLRRRLSRGLQVSTNYTFAVRQTSQLDTIHRPRVYVQDTSGVPQALKMQATYDLPFGRGKRFGANMPKWADVLGGGWVVNMSGRVQSGRVLSMGGVRLVGMTAADLQKSFKLRFDSATNNIYMLPQDIIDNTVKAFSTSATSATGYGALGPPSGRYIAPASGPGCVELFATDCGEARNYFLTGPMFTRFDLSVKKVIAVSHRVNVDVEFDALNVFDAVNFQPVLLPGTRTNADNYRVTSGYTDVSQTFDPGGRLGQIVWRVRW